MKGLNSFESMRELLNEIDTYIEDYNLAVISGDYKKTSIKYRGHFLLAV
jgi:hypothetical protein